ncbi:MAG: DedA family protein [Frankiales bacterium]|nr:DedA family protein [Frankiales bacterium]
MQPQYILDKFGTWAFVAVMVILFVECGLFLFFLPGDSLLFVTGLYIAKGASGDSGGLHIPLWLACVLLSAAAIAGNVSGYWIGSKAGPALFHRPDSRLLKPEYVEQTHAFFEKYGPRAIVLARFVPIVRTFITAMAGVGKMQFRTYLVYTTIGGILWASGLTILGYFLGNVEFVQKNIELIAVVIIALSLVPAGVEWWRARRARDTDAATS